LLDTSHGLVEIDPYLVSFNSSVKRYGEIGVYPTINIDGINQKFDEFWFIYGGLLLVHMLKFVVAHELAHVWLPEDVCSHLLDVG